MYPDFTFKTLAPRIDVTPRADANWRDTTAREPRSDRRDRAANAAGIGDLVSSGDLDRDTSSAEMDRLVERFMRGLERKRRIDRERRGL